MKSTVATTTALVLAAFSVGVLVGNLPHARAADIAPSVDVTQKQFLVSIDEVKQNLVFADEFAGRYAKTFTLSDGTTRQIELTPTLHNGAQVVQFKDSGGTTYMSLNGTTTNGRLMVSVRDLDTMHAQLKQEGWSAN